MGIHLDLNTVGGALNLIGQIASVVPIPGAAIVGELLPIAGKIIAQEASRGQLTPKEVLARMGVSLSEEHERLLLDLAAEQAELDKQIGGG